jgi:capsid protein
MGALQTASKWFSAWWGFNGGRAANAYPGSKVDDQYPSRPELSLDQKDLLSRMELRQLLNSGRHIYNSYPMVSGAANDIANNVIGQHWQPQYTGKRDQVWGRKVEGWLREYYKICDVRGQPFDLVTDLYVGVVTLIRDGEYFLHLTQNEAGYPMIQFLEAHRIGTRIGAFAGPIMEGPYKGLTQRNGIAYNSYSRPIAYRFLGDTPETDEWIDAARIYHVYDPKWFSQGRGISPLVYGILDWLDVHGWRQNEKMAQLIFSSIALLETNEAGAPSTLQERMRQAVTGSSTGGPVKQIVESFTSGMTRFMKINGSNIKALENARPSPNQANFEERILRGCFRAMGWTYEQGYDSSNQGGANVRRDVAQNQKSVEHMQAITAKPWTRVTVYGIAAADALGVLNDEDGKPLGIVPDFYKWRPQLPQKMTVDAGRDRRVDVEEIRAGTRTMIEDIRDRGGDEEEHIDEQIRFYKMKRDKAREAEIAPDEWVDCFGSLLINPSSAPAPEPESKEDDKTDPAKKKPDEKMGDNNDE